MFKPVCWNKLLNQQKYQWADGDSYVGWMAGRMMAPSYMAGSKVAYRKGNMICIAEVGSCTVKDKTAHFTAPNHVPMTDYIDIEGNLFLHPPTHT